MFDSYMFNLYARGKPSATVFARWLVEKVCGRHHIRNRTTPSFTLIATPTHFPNTFPSIPLTPPIVPMSTHHTHLRNHHNHESSWSAHPTYSLTLKNAWRCKLKKIIKTQTPGPKPERSSKPFTTNVQTPSLNK